MKAYSCHDLIHMTMTGEEQFYLVSEVEAVLKRQANAAISGMNAAKAISSHQLQTAARLRAESSPEALESERAANAALTEENDKMHRSLRNCLLLAMRESRRQNTGGWSGIIRFCKEAGVEPSPLRDAPKPTERQP